VNKSKVVMWRLQIETWFPDGVWEKYDHYLTNVIDYYVERDYLGSGMDLMTFGTKAERTKMVRELKKLGVPDGVIMLTKEIEG